MLTEMTLDLQFDRLMDAYNAVYRAAAIGRQWYPKQVQDGRLRRETADRELAGLETALDYLRRLKSYAPGLAEAMEAMENPQTILILTGRSGSGKSAAAKYLCQYHGFYEDSYAAPLKQMLAAMFGIPATLFHDGAAKAAPLPPPFTHFTPRALMQHVGTDLMREHFGSDIWVQLLCARITASRAPRLVITDARFDNELTVPRALLPAARIITARIQRDGDGHPAGGITEHASEKGTTTPTDHTLHNNGTLADLQSQLHALVHQLFPPATAAA